MLLWQSDRRVWTEVPHVSWLYQLVAPPPPPSPPPPAEVQETSSAYKVPTQLLFREHSLYAVSS
jgi:hypothetical protein